MVIFSDCWPGFIEHYNYSIKLYNATNFALKSKTKKNKAKKLHAFDKQIKSLNPQNNRNVEHFLQQFF